MTIRARLKAETAALHERVESAMPSLDALGTPVVYARCLEQMHRLYEVWEHAAHTAPGLAAAIPDVAERKKVVLLRRDLDAIGAPVVPTGSRLPVLDTAGALGAMYVMEGATLGGQVILRHIAAPLGLSAEHGLAFFTCYGARTGAMWTTFCAALDAWERQTGAGDRIVGGAIDCFNAFERELILSPPVNHAC